MSFTRKVGQKIQRPGGMVCEIMLIGDSQVAVKATDGKLYLLADANQHLYRDVPSFYQIGKRYKFKNRETIWQVMDLYTVGGKNSAICKKIEPWGEVDVEKLTEDDFSRMDQI